MKPTSDQEENELVILQLRQLSETKQKSHVHIGEAPQVEKTHMNAQLVSSETHSMTLSTHTSC